MGELVAAGIWAFVQRDWRYARSLVPLHPLPIVQSLDVLGKKESCSFRSGNIIAFEWRFGIDISYETAWTYPLKLVVDATADDGSTLSTTDREIIVNMMYALT